MLVQICETLFSRCSVRFITRFSNNILLKYIFGSRRLSGLPEAGDFSCFSRKVTSKRRRVCSESKKSFVDPQLQFHFDNFDYVHGCDLNRKTSNARSSK